MTYVKSLLRKKYILQRKKKYLSKRKLNFNSIFKLIKKNFNSKKITIAGYYPSAYELDILPFLQEVSKKNFRIVLPVIKKSNNMCFKQWVFKEPLCVNKYGMLEPENSKKEIIPDLIMVPLVAFDKNLNRIGYGKGYYDRALGKINKKKKNTVFLGIAYSSQKCLSVPVNKYDIKLHYIFTEQGIISSK